MRYKFLLISAVVALVATPALAFHDDGVAHCNGCHTMHNSQDGVVMNDGSTGVGVGNPNLLLYPNATDTCLNCHYGSPGSYHVWSNAGPTTNPGETGAGNFVFLEEDNLNDGHGGGDGACNVATCGGDDLQPCTTEVDCIAEAGGVWTWDEPIPGEAAGHTLISGIAGITMADQTLTAAPGGTYLATDLECTSCHDPHGNDSFRLTYRSGQTGGGIAWTTTIDADAISVFASEGDLNHNAYRSGYSDWCGQCHGDFHAQYAGGDLIHPSGEIMDGDNIDIYDAYRGTADCIANPPVGGLPCGSGGSGDSYLALVPFEDPDVTRTTATDDGPGATAKVSCVSCHRAHATSAPDAGRWDFNVTGLNEDGDESGSYPLPPPTAYGVDTQRSLCNKCHSKDEFDAPHTF